MKKLAIIAAAVLGVVAATGYAQADKQPGKESKTLAFPFIYSVKFVCGLQRIPTTNPPIEPTVKPGNYATSINIHNYHGSQVSTFRKVVVTNGAISPIKGLIMFSNRAIKIDCADIVELLPPPLPPFIEGFVEFGSTKQMSVAAVYTSQACFGAAGDQCTSLTGLDLEVVPQNAFLDQ